MVATGRQVANSHAFFSHCGAGGVLRGGQERRPALETNRQGAKPGDAPGLTLPGPGMKLTDETATRALGP